MRLLLLLCTTFPSLLADGFVELVDCTSDNITVVLNRTDPDVAAWIADPNAQPVLYVYDHKTRRECGTSLKNEQNEVNYNLSIPYGKTCDVQLVKIEPSYKTAEATIVLEDNADQSHFKTPKINHVFCLYTRNVQTLRVSDVPDQDKVVASTGGKPMPKVDMLFRGADGRPLRASKFGDSIEFYIALSPDNAYRRISPKDCVFSDREDHLSPDAKHFTFVQNGCPVAGFESMIPPLKNVNGEVYFSKFKTFRFDDKSTVFAHCTVQVCLDENDKECSVDCFQKVHSSNLTADRLRFRHKRSSSNYTGALDSTNEISIKSTLTVLDTDETKEISVSTRSLEQCLAPGTASLSLMLLIGLLASGFLLSTVCAIGLFCKIKKGKQDSFEVYGAYFNSTTPATAAFRY